MINRKPSMFRITKDSDAMMIETALKPTYDHIASISHQYVLEYKKLLEDAIYKNLDTSILLQMKECINNEPKRRNIEV